jgi:N-acetylglucosaminyl-diphospho-decaprenol L-rhamnosyltransferase
VNPAHASPDIAVVVVTYRSQATIDDCLARLRAAGRVAAVRVVDNASDDATLAHVQRHAAADPRVRFIANPGNPGFGVACNQGAADVAASAPECRWLAFVNPDAMVEPDSLARLAQLAEAPGGAGHAGDGDPASGAEAGAGVASPPAPSGAARAPAGEWLLGADLVGEDGIRDPAARRRDPDFGAMLAAMRPGRRNAASMAIAPDDGLALQPVDAVSGALMLMPRALFERIGGFDEAYRLHAEDLDLCRRAREAGARIAVANRVRVLHVRGVSSRSRPVFVEWHKHRGLWRYFARFEAPRRGLATRVAVWLAVWARFPLAVARRYLQP